MNLPSISQILHQAGGPTPQNPLGGSSQASTANAAPHPFRRLFPTGPLIRNANFLNTEPLYAVNGDRLGALWGLPIRAPGAEVRANEVCYSLTLDPEYTTPGAAVGVAFDSGRDSVVLRPGERIVVPEGFERFYCWNAIGWIRDRVFSPDGATHLPLGAVAFLAGTTPGALPQFTQMLTARGYVSLLWEGSTAGATAAMALAAGTTCDGYPAVVTSGLRGLRVAAIAVDAGGARVNPVDLAATLRPWVLTPLSAGSIVEGTAAASVDAPLVAGFWAPCSDNDLVISSTQQGFDREVSVGALAVAFQRVNLAGVAVNDILISIEGY